MISVKNITKSFRELEVLKGIDAKFEKGEIVSVVGASGAGKTTFLQILGTLSKPDTGEIIFSGNDTSSMREKQLSKFRNQKIGFIFQFHQLLPEFTALENVCIPAFIAGIPRKVAEARAKEVLEILSLSHRLQHKPNELSGGEQQRVAVARALINSPEVILADEPSGNLDSQNKKELHELFFKLRDAFHHTFIIVTHDRELAQMADRMLVMADGKIIN